MSDLMIRYTIVMVAIVLIINLTFILWEKYKKKFTKQKLIRNILMSILFVFCMLVFLLAFSYYWN
jgi:hypothetical protein